MKKQVTPEQKAKNLAEALRQAKELLERPEFVALVEKPVEEFEEGTKS